MSKSYASFSTDTSTDIVNTFGDIIEHGSPRDVDDAFAALKLAPERIRRDVVAELEKLAVEIASHIGKQWNSFQEGSAERKLVMFNHASSIRQLPWVFIYLDDLKNNDAQPLTRALAARLGQMKPSDKFKSEKLAEIYGAAYAAVQQQEAAPEDTSAWSEPGVLDVFQNLGRPAWEHISAQIDAMDKEARDRLMAECEQEFLSRIKLASEDITAGSLLNNLRLGKYFIAARGAAADPLLVSYVEAVSAMPIKEGGVFHPPEILAVAQAHVGALESHAQLKQLAEARKKRAAASFKF